MRYILAAILLAVASVAQAGPRPKQAPIPPQAPPVRPVCVCGNACVCKPGLCPGGCAVASKPDLVTTDGRTIRWTGNSYVFVGGTAAVVQGCPDGRCPLKR